MLSKVKGYVLVFFKFDRNLFSISGAINKSFYDCRMIFLPI